MDIRISGYQDVDIRISEYQDVDIRISEYQVAVIGTPNGGHQGNRRTGGIARQTEGG